MPSAPTVVTINPDPVTVIVDDSESASGLTLAVGDVLQIVNNPNGTTSGNFTILGAGIGTVDVAGTVQVNSTIADPTLTISLATVTIESTGKMEADGSLATIVLSGDTITNHGTMIADNGGGFVFNVANLDIGDVVNNYASMTATSGGAMLFEFTEFQNMSGATVEADSGGIIDFVSSPVSNAGTFDAGAGGTIEFLDTTLDNAGGTTEAIGAGARVLLSNSLIHGGTLTTGNASSSTDGIIEIVSAPGVNFSEFDGFSNGAMTVDAYVKVDSAAALDLVGNINLAGTIAVSPGGALSLAGATVNGGTIDLLPGSGTSSIAEISIPGVSSVAPAISAERRLHRLHRCERVARRPQRGPRQPGH